MSSACVPVFHPFKDCLLSVELLNMFKVVNPLAGAGEFPLPPYLSPTATVLSSLWAILGKGSQNHNQAPLEFLLTATDSLSGWSPTSNLPPCVWFLSLLDSSLYMWLWLSASSAYLTSIALFGVPSNPLVL